MKFTNDELKLLTVLAVSGAAATAIQLDSLSEFFDRPCKLRKSVRSLERWGIVAHDPYQAVVRLLPERVMRALACGPAATTPELFTMERPLDAALAQACDVSARGLPPPRAPEHGARVAAHAACVPGHAVEAAQNVGTFKREDVSTIKRETLTCESVRQQVREFVGVDDYELHWTPARFWTDAKRVGVLQGTLRFLRAGIQTGDIKTKTTPGKHLWNQFRHDCRASGIEAMV